MKKFIRMAAMLTVAGAALLTSCTKDYSNDIKDLQDQVAALNKTIDAIQGQIDNGAILTAVNQTANGIQVVTTAGTYEITNGKDGKDGAAGAAGKDGKDGKDGTVWTIGEDGYWYCDGVKSAYAKGSTVTVEKGVLYIDGKATEIASKGITAVWNAEKGALELYGVEGGQGDNGYVCISLDGKLKSLVFDPKAYIDGVEAINANTLVYWPYEGKKLDSKDETWERNVQVEPKYVSQPVVAEYFVNPKSAVITADDKLEFIINNDPFRTTRVDASKDFDVKAEFLSYADGKLKVNVTVIGTAATVDSISVVALKVTPAAEETEAVVSDFATIDQAGVYPYVIADPKAEAKKKSIADEEEHYRTKISEVDIDAFNDKVVWSEGSADIDETKATCDTVVVYNQSLDLYGVVAAHTNSDTRDVCREANQSELDSYGLTWDFAIVKNYKVGDPATDQADFISLADGILTPKVFETAGKASIGRTPIIRVRLMNGEDVVSVAYVKVLIVDESEVPAETPKYELDVFTTPTSGVIGTFEFDCEKEDTLYTSVEQMNVRIYNDLKMSKDVFHSIYNTFKDITDPIVVDGKKVETVGTAIEVESENAEVESTHTIAWIISAEDIWKTEGETLYHDVKYTGDKGEVIIRLKADVKNIKKAYDVAAPDYIKNYWNSDLSITYANVHTPDKGETDPTECVFVADLNAPFVTDAGKLKLDKAITNFEYFFCKKDVEAIKWVVEDSTVVYMVSDDLLELSAALAAKKDTTDFEVIATITNGNGDVPFNTITLNKESRIGKKLLNTADGKEVDGLYTYIGVTGYICDDENKPVQVTFQGQDHYRMNFIRPINIDAKASDYFVDAVDFGEEHSYIDIKDLINPYDWRGRYFNEVKNKVEIYANYWEYYGEFKVTVDTEDIECDLNGERQALPKTIIVEQVDSVAGVDPASDCGYITYRNNHNNVDTFHMYIKVNVEYGWGIVKSDEIEVTVYSTIGVVPNN